jgi:hypothetical protein
MLLATMPAEAGTKGDHGTPHDVEMGIFGRETEKPNMAFWGMENLINMAKNNSILPIRTPDNTQNWEMLWPFLCKAVIR